MVTLSTPRSAAASETFRNSFSVATSKIFGCSLRVFSDWYFATRCFRSRSLYACSAHRLQQNRVEHFCAKKTEPHHSHFFWVWIELFILFLFLFRLNCFIAFHYVARCCIHVIPCSVGILQISPRYEDGTKNDAKTVKNDNFVNDEQKEKVLIVSALTIECEIL